MAIFGEFPGSTPLELSESVAVLEHFAWQGAGNLIAAASGMLAINSVANPDGAAEHILSRPAYLSIVAGATCGAVAVGLNVAKRILR